MPQASIARCLQPARKKIEQRDRRSRVNPHSVSPLPSTHPRRLLYPLLPCPCLYPLSSYRLSFYRLSHHPPSSYLFYHLSYPHPSCPLSYHPSFSHLSPPLQSVSHHHYRHLFLSSFLIVFPH